MECQERSRKQFHHEAGIVKLLHTRLSITKDPESSLQCSGGPVNIVHGCFSVRRDLESRFHHCGGTADLVYTCLSVRRDIARSSVKLVNASLCVESYKKQLSPLWASFQAATGQFMCQ